MASRRTHGSKRNSGIFDPPVTGIQRRTSKRASSSDRQGRVYEDGSLEATAARAASPEASGGSFVPVSSPTSSSVHASSPSTSRSNTWASQDGAGSNASFRETGHAGADTADHTARPRTRTLEERYRERSPTALAAKTRNHHGSVHALPSISPPEAPEPSSSIGFPSIEPSNRPLSHRHRLVKAPPPRPLSPAAVPPPSANIPALPSPLPDTTKILQLMKITCGRMHGILFFRTTSAAASGHWSSGYCAINVATGSLIYQMKGDVSHAKTLVPDLRGCTVRTQNDADARASFLEIVTRTSGLGVHLRPHVPETFDSWLAALLCWQPLRARGARHRGGLRTALPGPAERRAGDRRRSSVMTQVRDAAIIKVGKMLCWDHDARAPAPPQPDRRISTYRQQRHAAGTPWRKVSCTLQENGLLKIYVDASPSLLQVVPLALLARCAVQRLHPTVLDDEFCVAVYPQYAAMDRPPDFTRPVFLSLESRVPFEVWFVLLRGFTVPELYGPERPRVLRSSVDLSVAPPAPVSTDGLFRVERVLGLRIVEAKVFAPQTAKPASSSGGGGGGGGPARAPRTHGVQEAVLGDYHAEVVLDGEVRGRTAVKTDTSNPFWREDYEFAELPPELATAAVLLKSRSQGQKDWTLISDERCDYESGDVDSLGIAGDVQVSPLDSVIGSVDLRLDDAERGRDVEQWWPVRNAQGQLAGEMLMKIRLDETVILMSHDYRPLSDLLHAFSNGLTQEVALACPAESHRKLHEIMLNIFQVSGRAGAWLQALVEDEIDGIHRAPLTTRYRYGRRIASNDSYDSGVEREVFLRDMGRSATAEAHLLFRGNSLLTKALDLHMRRVGREYLEATLGERIRDIDESDPDCEVDPNRVRAPLGGGGGGGAAPADAVARNWRNLIALTENLWRAIAASAMRCPPELRVIFRHIWSCADDRFGKFLRTVTYSSVSGFLFLRFFCPAVLNPKLFGLLKGACW